MRGHARWIILPLGVTLKWARRAACVWSCFRPPEANLKSCKRFTVIMRHVWGDYVVTSHIGNRLQLLFDLRWRVWKWSSNYEQVEQINRIANYFGRKTVVKTHILIRHQDTWRILELGCAVGVAWYLVVRSARLSSDWINGFKKNLLRALYVGDGGYIYQRFMEFCALFMTIWLLANFLS